MAETHIPNSDEKRFDGLRDENGELQRRPKLEDPISTGKTIFYIIAGLSLGTAIALGTMYKADPQAFGRFKKLLGLGPEDEIPQLVLPSANIPAPIKPDDPLDAGTTNTLPSKISDAGLSTDDPNGGGNNGDHHGRGKGHRGGKKSP